VRLHQQLPGCIKINSNRIEDRMYFSLSGQEQDTTQRQMGKLADTYFRYDFLIYRRYRREWTALLFSISRCENWGLICELQNIAMVLLVICSQLTGALVFFICELQMKQ
jgi:hypothetical protein